MAGKIFISYRREDSSWSTGRIYDRLIKYFSEEQIFIDVDSIALGDDFVTYIEESVTNCDVLLAIIGQRWLETIQTKSQEIDFVRLEIVAALKNNIRVIPILVENTKMPIADSLPEELKLLARRNAFLINYISFNSEMEKLVQSLKKIFLRKEARPEEEQVKPKQVEEERQGKSEDELKLKGTNGELNIKEPFSHPLKDNGAYIKGYTYDVFISYSHLDNIKIFNEPKGWIEEFHDQLNILLSRRIGKRDAVKFWWDAKKLDGSRRFDSYTEEAIMQSAIMICLVSPGYLQSDYCRKELESFYNKVQQEDKGLIIGNRSRIINVLMNNIPYTEWPKEFNGTTGFNFNDARDRDDFGDTIEVNSEAFRNSLRALKEAVVKLIDEFSRDEIMANTITSQKTNKLEETLQSTSLSKEFLTQKEIRQVVSEFIDANETVNKDLLIFKTATQHTWLVSTDKQLFCLLDDEETRTNGKLIMWHTLIKKSRNKIFARQHKTNSGLLDIGERKNWLYSTALFPDTDMILRKVNELLF